MTPEQKRKFDDLDALMSAALSNAAADGKNPVQAMMEASFKAKEHFGRIAMEEFQRLMDEGNELGTTTAILIEICEIWVDDAEPEPADRTDEVDEDAEP